MSEGTTPSLRDEDNPHEETGSAEQKNKTPPPLPSSNPVVKNPVPTGDLIQFENEEERAATVGEPGESPMDTTESNPIAITEGNNPKLRTVLETFIQQENKLLTSDYSRKFYQIRIEQEKLRADPDYVSTMAVDPKHTTRNRYRDILPYDRNRVIIREEEGNYDGYMNASHIQLPGGKAKFIAAQAPLPSTLDEWWTMIDDQEVTLIVILCKLVENGKIKCERYWPEKVKDPEMFGEYEVTVEEVRTYKDDEYVLRVLTMEKLITGETRTVYQLHYNEWPDHGCPKGSSQLINAIDLMEELRAEYSPNSPILVHCSAGVGRTGTIIAINHIREQIKAETLEEVDLWQVVMELRKQRASMVQTQEQFVFVHRCVVTYCRRYLGLPEMSLEAQRLERLQAEQEAVNLIAPPTPTTGDQQPGSSDFQAATNNLLDDIDDLLAEMEGSTSVPDFPDEPPAPKGPEDLGDSAAN